MPSRLSLINGRGGGPGLLKSIQPNPATVTTAASPSLVVRVVATQSQRIIDTQAKTFFDDLRLGESYQRRMNSESPFALDTRLGGQVRQALEGGEVLRPAI